MKKLSEEVDYELANGVEIGKIYKVDFQDGVSSIEGLITSARVKVHTGDKTISRNATQGIVQQSAIIDFTIDTGGLILIVGINDASLIEFYEKVSVEAYEVDYGEIENIIVEHYKNQGIVVQDVEFDSKNVNLYITK